MSASEILDRYFLDPITKPSKDFILHVMSVGDINNFVDKMIQEHCKKSNVQALIARACFAAGNIKDGIYYTQEALYCKGIETCTLKYTCYQIYNPITAVETEKVLSNFNIEESAQRFVDSFQISCK